MYVADRIGVANRVIDMLSKELEVELRYRWVFVLIGFAIGLLVMFLALSAAGMIR